ncbi:MAG: DMT family transporter [Melioribacteraceae bacterium]|nr:DMT family transporter [Melioribacteraceae bacterium]
MNKLNRQSLIYTLSAIFFWSTVATAFKITLEGMNFAQLLFYASLVSCAALGFFVIKEKNTFAIFSFKSIGLGFINPFLYYMLLFNAYTLLPAQEAQPLNYTWPIVLSLFSVLFLKEKMNFKKIIGLLSAFVGVVIIATRGRIINLEFDNLFGVAIAVSSSLVWAAFWILNLNDERSNSVKLFGAFFWGTIFSGAYLFFFNSFKLENYNYLFGAGFVGLFEMGITFLLWNKGLELSNDKAKTATLAYLAPFLSLLFIAFLLGETILPSSIAGLVFIVGGIVYQNLDNKT